MLVNVGEWENKQKEMEKCSSTRYRMRAGRMPRDNNELSTAGHLQPVQRQSVAHRWGTKRLDRRERGRQTYRIPSDELTGNLVVMTGAEAD
jgi:hypothetical protein